MAIKLGEVVTDSITGCEGVAISRTEFMTGCTRVGIQPKKLNNDGAPVDLVYLDELRLVENNPKTTPTPNRWLGKQVTCSMSGIKGVCTSHTTYLYAAARVGIQPKGMTDDGKAMIGIDTDEVMLVEYIEEQKRLDPSTPLGTNKRPGGPASRVPNRSTAPR